MGHGGHIDEEGLDSLTDTQRAILEALQRPLREGGPYATPATNREIAAEVYLSVDAVKGHLRAIYARLGIDSLPQNAKRARLAEIGVSGAVDDALPPRPPEPVAVATESRSQRGRIPAMLSTVALGLVLLGVVVGLMLGRDGSDTIISQQPGFDEPGDPGKSKGGKGTLLGELPGPWSDDGLFAAGPAVPVGYELAPGVAGAAPVSSRGAKPRRRTAERGEVRGGRRGASGKTTSSPGPAAAGPTVTTTPTRRARRTCTTRRQVTYRPRTVTVRRVRLHPHRVRKRVVRYRREVRMVPVQRQVPNGNGQNKGNGDGNGNGKKNKNGKGGQGQGGGTHTETVYVRQVRRVPVVKYVTRTRMHRHVRFVKVTKRQRMVRSVRSCR